MSIRVHRDWLLTPYRLAVHEPTSTAVIADVHLGYCEARQQCGEAIPLRSMAAQLAALRQARNHFAFDRLLVAGDLFERAVRSELLDQFLAELSALAIAFAGLAPGNHDRGWEAFRERIPIFPDGVALGAWHIVHGDGAAAKGRLVLGHWHPIVHHQGRRLPCYLLGPQCLVLPAFSTDAAGGATTRHPGWQKLQRFAIIDGAVVELDPTSAPTRTTKNPRTGVRGLRDRTGIAGSKSRYQ